MFEVSKQVTDFLGLSTSNDKLDAEESIYDAFILAEIYAEEHLKRIMPDRGQVVKFVLVECNPNGPDTYGYRFKTNNGSTVTYCVK